MKRRITETICRTKIRDLSRNIGNLTLIAKVTQRSEADWHNGEQHAYAIIADETGRIKLNLHGKQMEQAKTGQTIRIKGVFTEVNDGFLEVSSYRDIELLNG